MDRKTGFSFGNVEFAMSIRHTNKYVEKAVEYQSMEVSFGLRYLGVISMQMIFKAMGLDGIIKGQREEDQGLALGHINMKRSRKREETSKGDCKAATTKADVKARRCGILKEL